MPLHSDPHPSPTRPAKGLAASTEIVPWIADGIVSGLLGAFVVAVFFLIIDLLRGHPFWTPTALGAALLQGRTLDPAAAANPVLTAAYTVLHGTVFLAFALPAAFAVNQAERLPRGSGAFALVFLALFACFETIFLVLGEVFLPGVHGALGRIFVVEANLLAAATMAGYLVGVARPRARRAQAQGASAER